MSTENSSLPGLVLASSSPRRKELLTQIGISIEVASVPVDEKAIRHSDPAVLASTLAVAKAIASRESLCKPSGRFILGADTVVVAGDSLLEKPESEAEARQMLARISGRTHQVITGIALLCPDTDDPVTRHASTDVTVRPLRESEIDWYIQSREWSGVAGGYRIQGRFARFVTEIHGSYSNVVGLPLALVYSTLCEHNWPGDGQDIPSAIG